MDSSTSSASSLNSSSSSSSSSVQEDRLLSTWTLYQAQYPSTTLVEAEFDVAISTVSHAIQSYLDRDLLKQVHDEYHDDMGDNVLITRQWPINKVLGVARGGAQYFQLLVSQTGKAVHVSLDPTDMVATYVIDFHDEQEYDYSGDATITAFAANLSADMAANGLANSTQVDSRYASSSPRLVKDVTRSQGGESMQWSITGVDLSDQFSFVVQGERMLVLSSPMGNSASSLYVKYDAGYVFPAGSDPGTLPADLIDVANRMVSEAAGLDTGSGTTAFVTSERLDDAAVTYDSSTAAARSSVGGLLTLFEAQLSRYRRKDIIRT